MKAPSPVGELGNVEMTQALVLSDTHWEAIGSDLLMTGYLPASGGLPALQHCLEQGCSVRPLAQVLDFAAAGPGAASNGDSSSSSSSSRDDGSQASTPGPSGSIGDDPGYRRTPNSADHKVCTILSAVSGSGPHLLLRSDTKESLRPWTIRLHRKLLDPGPSGCVGTDPGS